MMTKDAILLLMAAELGVADFDADGNRVLPGDPENLRRITDGFDIGRATLYAEDPRFAFSRPELTITLDPTGAKGIDGDPGRYALPYGVIAPPIGRMSAEYPAGQAGRGWGIAITSWARVNEARASSTDATGAPTMAAFWLLPSRQGDKGPRYEMRLNRDPDLAYILRAPFQVECVTLDAQDAEPSNYPLAVKAYGIWEVQKANPIATGTSQAVALAERNEWLARVIRNENARTPRALGHSAPGMRRSRRHGNSERDPQWQDIPTTLSDGSTL